MGELLAWGTSTTPLENPAFILGRFFSFVFLFPPVQTSPNWSLASTSFLGDTSDLERFVTAEITVESESVSVSLCALVFVLCSWGSGGHC